MGWSISAEKSLAWTAKVSQLSDDLAEWREFIRSLIGVRDASQVGGSQPVATLAVKEFQSRPHNIIPYIHNETLGQSSSNGLDLKVRPVTETTLFSWGKQLNSSPSVHSKSSLWPPLLAEDSNPDQITSFNISTMRHWDSPAAMLGQSTELFTLHTLRIQPVATLAARAFQFRPHNIIQYIHNETLGQSSSNGLDLKVCPITDSALLSVGATTELFTLLVLQISPWTVDTLSGKAFQSRPHNIIQYIHNETLGQSSSNGLDVKVCPVTDSALFRWDNQLHSSPSIHSKSSLWPPLLAEHSNPDHITLFNISTMRHWESPSAMVWI
eukprot:scaffold42660_cov46-Cyclotella_meneghiniana.AAC.1